MKTGRLFWGTFLLVVGAVALLTRFDLIHLHLFELLRFWPVILILWGIRALSPQPAVKVTITVFTGLALGILLGSLLSFSVWNDDGDSEESRQVQEFIEPYEPEIKKAKFSMECGAGEVLVTGASGDLLAASVFSTFGKYDYWKESTGDAIRMNLKMQGNVRNFRLGRHHNRVELRLNVNPIWDMDFDIGAASADLDLSKYKTESISIDAGACDLRLKLGELMEQTNVVVSAGASSIRIAVPESVGCEVDLDTGLSGKHLSDFEKIDSDTYRTENFDTATNKIYLTINAGVSSIRVTRY